MNPKIKSIKELLPIVEELKRIKKVIVTTNGVFDLLHVGHVRYLKKAKDFGDILIVAINSDKSVKRFKGEKRPIFNENDRAEILSSLLFVDFVTIFEEDTPLNILSAIKPHYHIKGGSFLQDRIESERLLVESYGGKLLTFPLEEGYSTTLIIKKILNTYYS